MATSRLLGSISAVALLTLAVPLAHAGGGMGTGDGNTACRIILNGQNPPQVLSLNVDTLPEAQQVGVGPALLLCDLAAFGSTVNNAPPTVPVSGTNIVCYSLQAAPNKEKDTVTIIDPFTAATPSISQTVSLGGLSLLCVQAQVTFSGQ
jgi:hypothetical protein